MNRLTIAPLACLALAACNQQASVSLTNASPEEVAVAAKKAGVGMVAFKPGQWETRTEILDMNFPGMDKVPKQYLDQMKSKMAVRTRTSCMTPKEAENRDGSVLTGEKKGNCRFEKYDMGGGKIDATMVCKGDRGEMRMHMSGSFTPETFALDNEMTGTGAMGEMHTKAKVTGKRVGECPANGE